MIENHVCGQTRCVGSILDKILTANVSKVAMLSIMLRLGPSAQYIHHHIVGRCASLLAAAMLFLLCFDCQTSTEFGKRSTAQKPARIKFLS